MIDGLVNAAILLVILVGLVLVHELGHFVTAKRAGVRVHEFGIGFPPRALVLFRRGETTYSLNWLPIGGFVRLEGEEGESVDSQAFVNQRLGTRMRILLAGVAVNFAVAWLIFTLIAMFAEPTWKVRIDNVLADSPAAKAGLVGGNVIGYTDPIPLKNASDELTGETRTFPIYDDSGDLILAIDGIQFAAIDDLSKPDVTLRTIAPITYLADRAGTSVMLRIEHADGDIEDIEATLRTRVEVDANLGALGFDQGLPSYGSSQNGPVESVVTGLERTVQASTLVLRGVVGFARSLVSDDEIEVSGPVGIASTIGIVRESAPPVILLWLVGVLSANLAVINLLPLPPMDGGRIAMALLQAASGNRVSVVAERLVYLAGFVLLMSLLVIVTANDIVRLVA